VLSCDSLARMTGYVALLRGINVGGRATLPMATLREVAEGLGYTRVSTYIASGNLFLEAGDASPGTVETALHDALLEHTGLELTVVARTRAQLTAVVATNPFPDAEPQQLHVSFLTGQPTAAGITAFETEMGRHPERAAVIGQEAYIDYVNGAGRTKVSWDRVARAMGVQGTARNWRTVLTLLDRLSVDPS